MVLVVLILLLVVLLLIYQAVYSVLTALINFQIYGRFTTRNMAIAHSVLSIILPLYESFCLFALRNRDFNPGMEAASDTSACTADLSGKSGTARTADRAGRRETGTARTAGSAGRRETGTACTAGSAGRRENGSSCTAGSTGAGREK